MAFKVISKLFVEGRDTYVDNIPLLSVFARMDAIEEAAKTDDEVPSYVAGWLDGLLADMRLAAKNAREEIDQRGPDVR